MTYQSHHPWSKTHWCLWPRKVLRPPKVLSLYNKIVPLFRFWKISFKSFICISENNLQIIYLYLLERTKMVCTLLRVSSWYNKSLCFDRDRLKVFNSLFPKKPIQSHLNLLGMKNTHKSPSSPNFPRFRKECKTYELYFDYNCHFLDTAGLRETVKLLKLKKKNPTVLVLLTREKSNFLPQERILLCF